MIACLLPLGMLDAFEQSQATKIYIANAANFPPGHCDGYHLGDYLSEIRRLTGIDRFDHILAHDGTGITENLAISVESDPCIETLNVLTTPANNIDGIYDSIRRNTLRHDGETVVQWIKKIFS